MTSPDRQNEVKRILDEAADLTVSEREAFLDRVCADDQELRSEVESLLAHLEVPTDTAGDTRPLSSPPTPTSDPTPMPKSVGPYEIIDKIGEGGMGVVYKATQKLPRRTVALKVIKPHMVSRHALERFNFETQVLGRLQHAGIAQIHDAGTTETDFGEQPYFAMEYIRGTPLAEYVKVRHCTLQERLTLVQKIADAVHHAHTRGVVHRDIKPANILVTEDGQPKILDFGVARSIGPEIEGSGDMTRVGQLVGTVPYMSPEQVAGDSGEIDARSDIYSLGVVLYELLAGHLPYDLEKRLIHEAVRVIQEVEPEHLSSVSRVYKGDIETIVGKALSKERTRRYQSASEFAADIHRYLTNQPITARPASAWYQVTKLAKRHKVSAIGLGVAVAGIVIGLGVALVMLDRAQTAEDEQKEANRQLGIALKGAETQRDRAEAALTELASLMETFAEFEREISRLEGATSARRVLASQALEVLERLRATGESYPWIRREVASASLAMGEIALAGSETLEEADRAFALAFDEFTSLLEDEPDDTELEGGRLRAMIGQSAVNLRKGSTQAAASLSATAEIESKRLSDLHPEDQSLISLCASAMIQRAGLLRYQSRYADALAKYEEAAGVIAALDTSDPENQELAIRAIRGKAAALEDSGNPENAEIAYNESLALARSFVDTHPRDLPAKLRLMEILHFLAERRESAGSQREALTLHTERLSVATELMRADPENEAAEVAAITSHDAIAHAHLRLGEYDRASRSGQVFLTAARQMADADPTDLIKHRRVGLAEELLGDIERTPILDRARQVDDPDDEERAALIAQLRRSLPRYTEAFRTYEWLETKDPAAPIYIRDSGRVKAKEGETLDLIGRLEMSEDTISLADEAYAASGKSYARLMEMGELTNEELDRWARTLRNIGTAALNRGEGARAARWLEEADTIYPRETASIVARKAAAYSLAGDDETARTHALRVLEMLDANPDTRGASVFTERMNRILADQPLP